MALIERYRGFTVASLLSERAATDASRAFLHTREGAHTFGEIEAQAEALAGALCSFGVERGDRVALVMPSCPEFVVSMLAAAKLGAVVVPFNPALTTPELQYMLRHCEAVVAVSVGSYGGVDFLEIFEDLLVELPELQYLVTVGEADLWYDDRIFPLRDLVSMGEGRSYPAPELEAATAAFAILYTSGTTGKPKGVALSHGNILYAAAATADALSLTADDRIAGVSALFHVFGMGPGLLGCLLSGASLVLTDGMGAAGVLDLVEEFGVSVHYGTPTLFATELREQAKRPRDLSSLRLALAAGAPVSGDLAERVERELCPTLLVAYTLTEAASTVAVTRPEDEPGRRRFTVGPPVPGTQVRIMEGDVELPSESVGEIAVKGEGVMVGYYRQPLETRSALGPEGFFRTGDLGMLDEDGFLHLVGRRKEVIIRTGFNVYPRELEDRLHAHPAVHEAAVVGVPDDILGEAICACVVPVEGALVTGPEIRAWCRETLPDYKIPDLVRFFDAFPGTGTGKVRRVELTRLVTRLEHSDA